MLAALWAVGSVVDDDSPEPEAGRVVEETGRGRATGQTPAPAPTADETPTSTPTSTPTRTPNPTTAPVTTTAPPPRTHLVRRVVDGDTVELGNGEVVRLVGIDTPEVGECGYDQASTALAVLVLGRRVVLVRPAEDRDRYGRLLRYVDVAGADAGLRLVRQGLAAARYDSRDGYGRHPREDRYVAVDRRAPDVRCARPAPLVTSADARCEPGYAPCVPAYPPDVDCADIAGPVRVTGPDPHRLDADGDGTACE